MFNYIHETIVNDASRIHDEKEGLLIIERGGNYDLSKIFDSKVYVSKAVEGKKAKAVFTWTSAPTDGKLMRITIFLSTPSTEFAEFAMPNWHEFGKPFVIETKAGSAQAVADAINLSQGEGNKLFTATVSTKTITLETTEDFLDFAEVHVATFKPASDGNDEVVDADIDVTITHSSREFGTAKWIRENLRFPSGPNMRYTPLYADEAPIAGTKYNQYSFQYVVERAAPGGLSGVNQVVSGLSTQVIYVPADSQAETKLKTALNKKNALEVVDFGTTGVTESETAKTEKSASGEQKDNG